MSNAIIPVEIAGISYYQPSRGYAVLLKELDGGRQVPIIVGGTEAQAIAMALEGVEMPRPLTHDLLVDILDQLNVEVSQVVITHLSNGTFYAQVLLVLSGEEELSIDSRPSDAIAIALRTNAPIFISDAVMHKAGVENLEIVEMSETELNTPADVTEPDLDATQSIARLELALQQAIEGEEYEVAAKIRDRIALLKNDE